MLLLDMVQINKPGVVILGWETREETLYSSIHYSIPESSSPEDLMWRPGSALLLHRQVCRMPLGIPIQWCRRRIRLIK